AWNGELPGTLPMVCGTGEAPSGIVAYEHDAFPADYRGTLLGTSWGDHVLQKFPLVVKGASFTSKPEIIVKGGENFRPVGMALAPDGSIFISDWVDRSYELHGKGRLWRIRAKSSIFIPVETRAPKNSPDYETMKSVLRAKDRFDSLFPMLENSDPFLVAAAIETLSRQGAPFLKPHVAD